MTRHAAKSAALVHFSCPSEGVGTAMNLPSRGTHLLVTNISALPRKCGAWTGSAAGWEFGKSYRLIGGAG